MSSAAFNARRLQLRFSSVLVLVVLVALVTTTDRALGAAGSPAWTLTSMSTPTNFAPGGVEQAYVITATNTGDAAAEGESLQISIADVLPPHMKVGAAGVSAIDRRTQASLKCEAALVVCTVDEPILPGDAIVMTVGVEVEGGLGETVTNTAQVAGGGAAEATSNDATVISTVPAGFGIEPSSVAMASASNQAGAHADFTTTFSLNQSSPDHPSANLKDIQVDTPPGIVGDPTAVPTCTMDEVTTAKCPQDAAVGVVTAGVEFGPGLVKEFSAFVYNLKPYATEPAALGFVLVGEIPVRLDFAVRSNGDYGLRATATGLNDIKSIISTSVTLWGVPADHNGPGPFSFFDESSETEVFYGGRGGGVRKAFLRNPTACPGSTLPLAIAAESWEQPGFQATALGAIAPFQGCDRLVFNPSVTISPDTAQAGAPVGYTVDVHTPQSQNPDGLASPDLKKAVVSLPPGAVVSPSAANGLVGCSDSPSGPAGDQFGLHSLAPASCPHGSQIGTVQVSTPLLQRPLEGQVFVGTPLCAPCSPADAQSGRMIRVFVQAQGDGTIVKLEGTTSVNQASGQLTTTFDNNPQLPFEDVTIKLNGGPRAPVANALACGPSSGLAEFTPYSNQATPVVLASSPTELDGCEAPAFTPTFSAGTVTNQAGGFSAETVSMARPDRQQDFGSVSVKMPPGLLANISDVPRCADAEAQAGTCSAASQVGTTLVAAGPGSEPFYLGGTVFLTGPYRGAPFGLAFLVRAVAGPYDLGNVVVRATIEVDPTTGSITIISDPLPQAIDGIPLRLRALTVNVNRPNFTFNATSCNPMSINGTISSAAGLLANVSSRYQASNCRGLSFKPHFSAVTTARTSKLNGASLHVKVTSGAGQANIAKARVELPIRLPSRLTTLQKACLAATFNSDPASCPSASVVGTARAVTPILKAALIGPAYLVSHGGAAFPDLVVVLQGEGVTLRLVGNTNIKKGITSSTFNVLPDAPVSSFDLVLPQGPHSVLAAFGSLCAHALNMPTVLAGQNGAVLRQTTKIGVQGCPRRRSSKKNSRHRK